MPWKKKFTPMSWEWAETFCQPEKLAETRAALAEQKWTVKDVLALPDGRIVIVHLKGTKIEDDEPKPKAKKAAKPTPAPDTEAGE